VRHKLGRDKVAMTVKESTGKPKRKDAQGLDVGPSQVSSGDLWLILGLMVLTLALRATAVPSILPTSDAGAYAIGVDHFDPLHNHPQPPGYHSYLMLVRGARTLLAGRTDLALYWLSILFTALGTAAVYLVGLGWYGRLAGFAAALLWATSPAVWRTSMMAQSHAAEVALTTLTLWAGARARARGGGWTVFSALLAGLAMMIRPQAALTVVPVWLVATWGQGAGSRIVGLLVMGLLTASSELGAAAACGSWGAYRHAVSVQWQEAIWPSTLMAAAAQGPGALIEAVQGHLAELSTLIFGGASHVSVLGWLPLFVYGCGQVFRPSNLLRDARTHLLLVWLVPIALFHFVVHVNNANHVLIYYPFVLLIAAAGLKQFCTEWEDSGVRVLGYGTCATILLGLAVVISLGVTLKVSVPGFKSETAALERQIEALRTFDARRTLFVQSDLRQQFNLLEYSLPDYQFLLLEQTLTEPRPSIAPMSPKILPEAITEVVFLNPQARVVGPARPQRWGSQEETFLVVQVAEAGRVMSFDSRGVRFSAFTGEQQTTSH
jgi:4-amino-4-deoxy-L-arabinose transferase-like glycosyltransferase